MRRKRRLVGIVVMRYKRWRGEEGIGRQRGLLLLARFSVAALGINILRIPSSSASFGTAISLFRTEV